ncbi:hypothetical protein HY500_00125 [Candidatus Woesearchaeota archaeon]|nr:hypothetical protein [Candidatus Woesearchaeota archaeon]
MRKIIMIILVLLLVPLVSASTLTVESVSKNPEEVKQGEVINLGITLENDGSKDIQDIRVFLDLTNLPFAPKESSEQFIDEIDNDEKGLAVFELESLPDARPGIYKIPVRITAENQDIQTFTSITVKSNPRLDVGIEESTITTVNERGKIVIRLANTGDGEIKFLIAKIPRLSSYEILTQNTFYIGNIEPDDFETIEAEILIKESIQAMPLEISYKDVFNKEYKKVYPLEVKTYSPEEAKQLGLIKNSKTPLIITVVIIALIIFFIYKRIKKKQ